jgi:hypothetical protein
MTSNDDWVQEVEDVLDSGTIPQQVDLMADLVHHLQSKIYLLKRVGMKVVHADLQGLLTAEEQEKYLTAGELLNKIVKAMPELFPPQPDDDDPDADVGA